MPNIKQTLVPQINRLLVQHLLGDHLHRDEVPVRPEGLPLVQRGDVALLAIGGGGERVRGGV